jgi:NAD(P)-dependent dehydrogenase (short-subunit alcohol dehydrogenase family)
MSNARKAVVTGGGRGIGRGIVLELARRGWSIGVNYRSDRAAALATCDEALSLGAPEAIPLPADVADLEQGRNLVAAAIERLGVLDLWVNNAGVAPLARLPILEATPESWDRVLGTNLRGPFFLSQAVAQALVSRSASRDLQAHPTMVFVTSISSTTASPSRADYCISKAGLSMAVQLFAAALAEHGIAVFEIRPGIIATDMTAPVLADYERRIAGGLTPIRRLGTPADVGRAVAAIADGAYPYSTGEVIHVDGGFHIPRL